MARGAGGRGAKQEKERRLTETLDFVITDPPYSDGFDPIRVSQAVLGRIPDRDTLSKPQVRKLRDRFDLFVQGLAAVRQRLDPVQDPDRSFDPADPNTVGRLVVIALLAQERVPIRQIRPTYGSGVYAIYYVGDHPAYREITLTETPIYVGKADPDEALASNPREQGVRLFGRLADHRGAIQEVETYATAQGDPHPLRVDDFECRRLVCATNAQLVAERHLISTFRPAWNSETKICFGISKHGDNAQTRRNKKSPWDVLHPGRDWAMASEVRVGMTPETITENLAHHFAQHPPFRERDAILEVYLDTFRQIGRAPVEESEAAAEADDVTAAIREDARHDQPDLLDQEEGGDTAD